MNTSIPGQQVASAESPARDLSVDEISAIASQLKNWAHDLGFQQCGITDTDLQQHGRHLQQWLAANHHGEMHYMASHGSKRYTPAELVPGTLRVISLRMDYWPAVAAGAAKTLGDPTTAYISRYTLGRDYHKLMRKRLASLASQLQQKVCGSQYRVFVDSAPVLERALAEKSGPRMDWKKHNAN